MVIPSPQELGLPFAQWRPGQRRALREILHSTRDHIVINAPTGTGKSAIAGASCVLQPDRRHVVLTGTHALQNAYGVFPWMVDLKGAGNYHCLAAETELKHWFSPKGRLRVMCDDGPCHVQAQCSLKQDGCLYYDQKRAFTMAQAGRTNYSAWLANRRVGQGLGVADVLLCDEAHTLLDQLMSACRVEIPHSLCDTSSAPRGYKGWKRWATDKLQSLTEHEQTGVKRERLMRGLQLLSTMDDYWAWDDVGDGWVFEPTLPKHLLPMLQTLDGHNQIVYLSATITPALLGLLGIPEGDVDFLTLPSTFPLARRPVYVVKGARADFRTMKKPNEFTNWMTAIDDICEDRDDRRGLIHPVSFARGYEIYEASAHKSRMILHRPGTRAVQVIEQFADAGPNAILISPSIMTGHDFKYKAAEFQILPKLPFPDSRSSIMRARVRHTPRYGAHHTMQQMVQACGRINRAEDDAGETFICDEHFAWWYRDNRDLSPDWFDEAVIHTHKRVQPPPPLN